MMPHFVVHCVSAVPFVIMNDWLGMVGCVIPDITWIGNEIKIRRVGVGLVHETIDQFSDVELLPYRISHSVLIWLLLCMLGLSWSLFLGVCIHIGMDLFTHKGKMNPLLLFPIGWRLWD